MVVQSDSKKLEHAGLKGMSIAKGVKMKD